MSNNQDPRVVYNTPERNRAVRIAKELARYTGLCFQVDRNQQQTYFQVLFQGQPPTVLTSEGCRLIARGLAKLTPASEAFMKKEAEVNA